MGNYSTAYYSAVALVNDMKHIHTHAKGTLFDNIHNICNEYYEKANEDADTLAELAIEKGDIIFNSSYLLSELNYKPTNYSNYDFDLAMHVVEDCIEKYLVVLANLRNKTDDPSVQSLLDDMMRYWNKEKDYKIKARLADSDWE